MTDTIIHQEETLFKKAGYRFLFLYVVLYIYPYGFEYIQELTTSDISFWEGMTVWFGETVFGWEFNRSNLMNGFDSKYDYSRFGLITVLSILGTALWLFIDAKRKVSYTQKLKVFLYTILRYHVGLTLILYGLAKVFMLQFGEMDLNRLEGTIGSHNGMSYLWTFMSYSKFYTMTSGWIEVIGGLFLLFRKTTFIGAIILFIAMANVVLIDIGYDVRVKMFAIHLFLMTLLLLAYDYKRLVRFMILNQSTQPNVLPSLFTTQKSKRIGYVFKGVLLVYALISFSYHLSGRIDSQTANQYPSLTGHHTIKMLIKNGDTLSLDKSNTVWKSMIINGSSYLPETLTMSKGNNFNDYFSFKADTLARTITFHPMRGDTNDIYQFRYKKETDKTYIFEGTHRQDTFWIKTTAKTLKDYPLTSKGIKWITDLE
ncbi:DoxX family protein [Dokdonia pacifica]|uniref:DoxX protein n=1 Tax=Dokdonia pacifica TaxID=1627892 RepID=A0A239AQA2_9FLAO|nr:DoxX family protein [Dokdonia pacifica]SNR97482.1 hypothetical protein SAMN06265376_10549 [Dokdonia pacifica]